MSATASGGAVQRFFGAVIITVVVLGFFAVLAGLGGAWWLMRTFAAPGPSTTASLVTVERGATLPGIARTLETEGVIENALIFRAAARVLQADRGLQAGEYRIPAASSMQSVLAMLTDGSVVSYSVTVPEGSTTLAILDIFNASPVLSGTISTPPAEGSLLPETYAVTRGEARDAIIARMAAAHDALVAELWAERADNLPYDTPEEAVILASIVEREAGGSEHDLVAGVFVNRLRRGMRLQADATIIYGLTKGAPLRNAQGERRTIRRSELNDSSNPYNTYYIDGLTPTPIAHPGRAALEAVMNPASTTALYFVADGTGGHFFSDTLEEHNRAHQRWREIRRQRLQEQSGASSG